ncbi:Ribonuclease D [Gammaproteobacteria bacterium]
MMTTQCCKDGMSEKVDYIDTPDALNQLSAQLRHSDFIAVDTEFFREKTYLPQLCLIQIATNSVLAIIDPLVLTNLEPLWEILCNSEITKVLHSGRQDLEIFYELCGRPIAPLFDTQIAATLLGHGDQVGYGALIAAECKIHLDKAHTRTDWTARPLDAGQLRYAADDVRYLAIVYPLIQKRLEQDGRLSWLKEDFLALSNPAGYGTAPTEAWRRVHGAQALQGRSFVLLQRLAAWREQQARVKNLPRRWIISDATLLELARHSPVNQDHLRKIQGMEPGIMKHYGQELLKLLRAEKEGNTSSPQTLPSHSALTMEQEALVDCLLAVVRLQCVAHRVSLASLTSRRDLEALISGETNIPLLHGWRRALAGQAVLDILKSQINLSVMEGQLRLEIRK